MKKIFLSLFICANLLFIMLAFIPPSDKPAAKVPAYTDTSEIGLLCETYNPFGNRALEATGLGFRPGEISVEEQDCQIYIAERKEKVQRCILADNIKNRISCLLIKPIEAYQNTNKWLFRKLNDFVLHAIIIYLFIIVGFFVAKKTHSSELVSKVVYGTAIVAAIPIILSLTNDASRQYIFHNKHTSFNVILLLLWVLSSILPRFIKHKLSLYILCFTNIIAFFTFFLHFMFMARF